jgi:hypothetical protein
MTFVAIFAIDCFAYTIFTVALMRPNHFAVIGEEGKRWYERGNERREACAPTFPCFRERSGLSVHRDHHTRFVGLPQRRV